MHKKTSWNAIFFFLTLSKCDKKVTMGCKGKYLTNAVLRRNFAARNQL